MNCIQMFWAVSFPCYVMLLFIYLFFLPFSLLVCRHPICPRPFWYPGETSYWCAAARLFIEFLGWKKVQHPADTPCRGKCIQGTLLKMWSFSSLFCFNTFFCLLIKQSAAPRQGIFFLRKWAERACWIWNALIWKGWLTGCSAAEWCSDYCVSKALCSMIHPISHPALQEVVAQSLYLSHILV